MHHKIKVSDHVDYREHLRRRLRESHVPEKLHAGLVEYFAVRHPPDRFLRAVLENDLGEASLRADEITRWHLADLAQFLFDYGRPSAWGSPGAVTAWLADPAPAPEIYE